MDTEVKMGNNCLHGLDGNEVNLERAFDHFLTAAQSENAAALVSAACMLLQNQGQRFDINDNKNETPSYKNRLSKARTFLQVAVKKGNYRAMYELGKIHLNESNQWEASRLLNAASRGGHMMSLVLAGKLSQLRGDNEDAVSKWTVAARKGCGEACNELGVVNYEGSMTELLQKSRKEGERDEASDKTQSRARCRATTGE